MNDAHLGTGARVSSLSHTKGEVLPPTQSLRCRGSCLSGQLLDSVRESVGRTRRKPGGRKSVKMGDLTRNFTCCTSRPGNKGKLSLGQVKANKDFVTLGRGHGGIDDLAKSLDEKSVMWGLVSQQVGSGSMARNKYVFLYFSGSKCPMVRRMRYTERRPAAVEALGASAVF
jgi:hypothetical protein